jgi:methyltransferase (TIGR00027 family)
MPENPISRMALWTAYFRGFHAQHASPKVFDDFLAARIVDGLLTEKLAQMQGLAKLLRAPEAVRASLDPQMQQALSALDRVGPAHLRPFADDAAAFTWIMQTMVPSSLVLSRARYSEDLLEEAIGRGVRQYVILGAGLDTFAFRRKEFLKRVRVFEIDHPDTQEGKRRRIAELGWAEPEGLHFVPVDLARESLPAALARVPYDRSVPTFVSWLGVTPYLAHDALLATMRSVAEVAPAGSELVFDYFESDAFVPEKRALRVHFTIREGERVGEPLKGGLDPRTLASDLARIGLRLREDLGPSEIQQRFFQGRSDGYYAFEQAHLACAVVG